jgi:hypothetical protein
MQSYWLLQMLVYAFTSRLQGVSTSVLCKPNLNVPERYYTNLLTGYVSANVKSSVESCKATVGVFRRRLVPFCFKLLRESA